MSVRRKAARTFGALAAWGACGEDEPTRPAAPVLELRPIVSSSPAPCAGGGLAFEEECLVVGPAAVDGDDVAAAHLGSNPPGPPALAVDFTATGDAAYRRLAEAQLGRRIAVVVDGEVVAAPTVQDARSSGGIVLPGVEPAAARRVAVAFARSGTDS